MPRTPRPTRRARLGRVQSALRVVADKIPPTPLGLLVAGAAFGAGWYYGARRQDYVLYVVGLGLGALLLVALLAVSVAAIVLALRLRKRPPQSIAADRLEAGIVLPTGFALPSLGWLPFVSLRWEWLEPTGVDVSTTIERGRMREQASHDERGAYPRVVRRLVVEDAFGLMRVGWRLVEERRRTVLPLRGRQLAAPLLESMAGGEAVSHPLGPPDGDLVDMRRYVAGDPMKRVLWKTYARTRQLMVRLPERAVAPTRRTLAYLVAGDGDEASAGVARQILETQGLGPDWRFGADGSPDVARRLDEAMALVVGSRTARDAGGAGLPGFIDTAAELGAFRLVLFLPPRDGPWLAPVTDVVRRHAGRVEVVIACDGIAEEERPGWRRFLLRAPDKVSTAIATNSDMQSLAERLAGAGAQVTMVDRPTGKPWGRIAPRRLA